jgi:hypothetical protein
MSHPKVKPPVPRLPPVARFRVVEVRPIVRRLLPLEGGQEPVSVVGVAVRALPVERAEGEWGQLKGWFANTPAGQIGIFAFGDEAKLFRVGWVFDLPVVPVE